MRGTHLFKLLLIISITVQFFSCEKREGVFVDTTIDFIVKYSEGNDLFNTENPNLINLRNIRLIYEINGEQIVYYNESMDALYGVLFWGNGEDSFLRIYPNTDINSELPVTYIDWGNGDVDKITCEIVRYDNGTVFINKVWFNDELVWSNYNTQGRRVIEIIK